MNDNVRKNPVVPANAGTQCRSRKPLGPRVRGDDEFFAMHFRNSLMS